MPVQITTLNPFLRAFFASSKLLSQCSPSTSYILLIPTTEFLLTHRERESGATYVDLATSEDVLSCHVIRVPTNAAFAPLQNKEGQSLRDTKGKAKQFSTLNGKTVIVKDQHVYTNKGFKNLYQVQILNDSIYYPETVNPQQWLVYFISRPLVGEPESLIPQRVQDEKPASKSSGKHGEDADAESSHFKAKDIKSFQDILDNFPVISRQMKPGLEKLYAEFRTAAEKSFVDSPYSNSKSSSPSSNRPEYGRSRASSSSFSTLSGSNGNSTIALPSSREEGVAENQLRKALENLVMSAIELFQNVDKHQLSLLGSSTNLSGSAVEEMLERHICQQFHDNLLFPRICDLTRDDDAELDLNMKQMSDVDLLQVGASLDEGISSRRHYSLRLRRGVEAFRRMENVTSSFEMVNVLLDTERVITSENPQKNGSNHAESEKATTPAVTSADTLVAMLLIVILRSSVTHLQARLAYMRDFLFTTDVESGEIGYALSTYEAVLAYLSSNMKGLKHVSKANRALWIASKKGNLPALKRFLEPKGEDSADEAIIDERSTYSGVSNVTHTQSSSDALEVNGLGRAADNRTNGHVRPSIIKRTSFDSEPPTPTFVPDAPQDPFPLELRPKVKKRVSMDARSMSGSSSRSYPSTISSIRSAMAMSREVSVEQLSQTRDALGHSVIMMAVIKKQAPTLNYLLHLSDIYQVDQILHDVDDSGTTLLSAAIQTGHDETIDVLVDFIIENSDLADDVLKKYISRADDQGRCAAHYIFSSPRLISQLGKLLPWNLKDKNGQTPLFALCRSYDHENYALMVGSALRTASHFAGADDVLHLDDHVDNKGNTLLHIINYPPFTRQLLLTADVDPNASNDKHFTPMMIASKFARLETVRILFSDPRIDLQARDYRGLTLTELAKDDEVRNRIDDMVLAASAPADDGQITTIVRSFFVEDGSVRMVLKHAQPNSNATITVTTCRRSLADFENLASWLTAEHPASYMPFSIQARSPFQIPSKPSRAVLRDIQLRLEAFLQALLAHPTFASHEMLWEFFLVPDIDMVMLRERAQRKSEIRTEKLREEYEPLLESVPEVQQFVSYAIDQMSSLNNSLQKLSRQVNILNNACSSLATAHDMLASQLSGLRILPKAYESAFQRQARILRPREYAPTVQLHYAMQETVSQTQAIIYALSRPSDLMAAIGTSREQLSKHNASITRSQRWPSALGLLDDTRSRILQEGLERASKTREDLQTLGRELRYTRDTVATELSGWQAGHAGAVRKTLTEYARRSLTIERERLDGLRRAMREIQKAKDAGS